MPIKTKHLDKKYIQYLLIRIAVFPFSLMPYRMIHFFGKYFGLISYYLISKYRKRTLSNLALAKDLCLDKKSIKKVAKNSFKNLAINCLEYSKLAREKDLSKIVECENPETALKLHKKKQGIIFFCGHQANWELLFLDACMRMKGIAIGKPIKNHYLYNWICSIREKKGGEIISQKYALHLGKKALEKGSFIGIVGDQGMPTSSYCFPFLGRKAWATTAPALLAYKSKSPIVVATIQRKKGKYITHYSDPIWPDLSKPIEDQIPHLMDQALNLFQRSVSENPDQWLWQHNRWKQQSPHKVYKKFRHDSILIILPEEEILFNSLKSHLISLKRIYPNEFLFLLVPQKYANEPLIEAEQVIPYSNHSEMQLDDYRFKLVYNFSTNQNLKKHYLKLSAFDVINLEKLKQIIASQATTSHKIASMSFSEIFISAICRFSHK